MAHRHTNSLVNETSPYLLQHAHNPVDWHAWNEAALTAAREDDKPILLSIGYSACHWCHVMEQESFEDEETARYMNEHFVCIKVDREERPDLDKIYQLAHQMLTQRSGGWPLNVVLTPDTHAPFFAGTYFPKVPRYGMPSFADVLHKVARYYRDHRQELAEHADAVKDAFARLEPARQSDIEPGMMAAAAAEISEQYDPVNGGFGTAPKFPHPTYIELCLRHGAGAPDTGSLGIARHTLHAMADGGVFDQIGGGFFRYSVDADWTVPHFEKMLYDNAQLLPLYADAWSISGEEHFRDVALSTAGFVMREMQSPEGGYYSTLDADSEGEEGRFYVWPPGELERILSTSEYAAARARFGLDGRPNFEGKWHLKVVRSPPAAAEHADMALEECRSLHEQAARKLFQVRERRIRPGLDDKILTSWNALMIKGMAHTGRLLQHEALIASAQRALDYLRADLWRNGRLLATARNGKAHLNAYLDDHAFLIDAIIELNQSRWRNDEIEFAGALADLILGHFEDPQRGGFFFTSDDHEELLHRSKTASDDSTPSGNGVACRALFRLGHVLGEQRYIEAAQRCLRLLSATVSRYPSAHGAMVLAVEDSLNPPDVIIIRGDPESAVDWVRPFLGRYLPSTMVFVIPDAPRLPGIIDNMKRGQATTAFLCSGMACSAPIHALEDFTSHIEERGLCAKFS